MRSGRNKQRSIQVISSRDLRGKYQQQYRIIRTADVVLDAGRSHTAHHDLVSIPLIHQNNSCVRPHLLAYATEIKSTQLQQRHCDWVKGYWISVSYIYIYIYIQTSCKLGVWNACSLGNKSASDEWINNFRKTRHHVYRELGSVAFDKVTTGDVELLLKDSTTKQCELDTAPVWLIKKLSSVFAPIIIAFLVNTSIRCSTVPAQHIEHKRAQFSTSAHYISF